jgi:hypothetical protein
MPTRKKVIAPRAANELAQIWLDAQPAAARAGITRAFDEAEEIACVNPERGEIVLNHRNPPLRILDHRPLLVSYLTFKSLKPRLVVVIGVQLKPVVRPF